MHRRTSSSTFLCDANALVTWMAKQRERSPLPDIAAASHTITANSEVRMQNFGGRVAVVTGAASGIGFGLAERFASEGMHVVLADIEEAPLAAAAQRLRSTGADVAEVRCDVSRAEDVDRLAAEAVKAFGAVHVICNNAGVADTSGASVWEASLEDWQWVVGVNLWGVVHGIRSFVPLLLQQDEGYVVNTASAAGLLPATLGSYSVTKHGVVALSESLQMQLSAIGAHVGVSVLCPGAVATRIMDAERNRPGRARPARADNPSAKPVMDRLRHVIPMGMPPSEIATHVVEAMREERLYVLPHPAVLAQVRQRLEDIEAGRPRGEPTAAH
jgi:NAD(P)-dependent dehydrogenase (short-subunit alcohol dehydrogenase family)